MKTFLWVTDPWHYLDHKNDTTLRLAGEAVLLKHRSFWCSIRSLELRTQGKKLTATAEVFPILVDSKSLGGVKLGKASRRTLTAFDSIHYRVDPPINDTYLHPLKIIEFGLRQVGIDPDDRIVNKASLLFSESEKIETLFAPHLAPPTLVTADELSLIDFIKNHGTAVLKPLHLCQSKGISLLSYGTRTEKKRTHEILSEISNNHTVPVLLQKYLPAIKKGELRAWYSGYRAIALARKYPVDGDFRVNVDRGSRLEAVTHLTKREQLSLQAISKQLKKSNIQLAAIDFIDGYITDFNFTSPGLLRQMEAIAHRNLAQEVIQALLRN